MKFSRINYDCNFIQNKRLNTSWKSERLLVIRIRDNIKEKMCLGGVCLATLKDIAMETGLSVSAVSRILNEPDFASPATRKKVFDAIESTGYVKNYMAKNMKDGKSRQIALIINDITNQFFSCIARGVEDVCNEYGYLLLLCNTDEDLARENRYLDLIKGKLCDGFIISVASETESRLAEIDCTKIPYVMVSRKHRRAKADFVGFDEYNGAYAAVTHLISLGHKRIATITGLIDSEPGSERQRGYEEALRDNGIEIDRDLIRYCDFRSESAYVQTEKLLELKNRPTAIFVANNLMTHGCLMQLIRHGIKIPDDMSLLNFYEPSWATIVTPQLTCIAADAYDMGHTAAELLFKRLNGDSEQLKKVVLPTSLTVRGSCGKIRG